MTGILHCCGLTSRYKIDFSWGNLRWELSTERLVFENTKNMTALPLQEEDIEPLLGPKADVGFPRAEGQGVYYIVR